MAKKPRCAYWILGPTAFDQLFKTERSKEIISQLLFDSVSYLNGIYFRNLFSAQQNSRMGAETLKEFVEPLNEKSLTQLDSEYRRTR